jgi:hypothetical protein
MNAKEVLEKLAASLTRASESCESNAERNASLGRSDEAIRLFGRASAYADAARYLLGSYLGDAVDELVQKPEPEARYVIDGHKGLLSYEGVMAAVVKELDEQGRLDIRDAQVTAYRIAEEFMVRISLEPVPMKPLREPTYGPGNIPRPAGPMGAPAEEKGEQK